MFHDISAEKIFKIVNSSKNGLTTVEANERLKSGKNEMTTQDRNNLFLMYLSQFKDLMVLLLIGAAIISAITAYVNGSKDGLVDTFIIVLIIFLNASVGFIQQYKADKALDKLKKLSISQAKVIRDGKHIMVDSTMLVKGDVVLLEEGDMVPADIRLFNVQGLMTDESSLTGESKRASKCTDNMPTMATIGDRKNMCFSSTFVVKGSGIGVVVATGMDTEIGQIAKMIGRKEDLTPLQKQLNNLGKIISFTVICVALIIFAVNMLFSVELLENFMKAVAIAVAAVPEGMPAVVTIIMAMGMQKMIRYGAVVRKLHVVETLGSCSVICSDKTGTLTQNKMQVTKTFCLDKTDELMRKCMIYCNTVSGKSDNLLGDPTEIALVEYARNGDYKKVVPQKINPFDSDRKMMSVYLDGMTYVKGAPDVVLNKCKYVYDFGLREITNNDKRKITSVNESMASSALRVLGFAYKQGDGEDNLVFVGLAGMLDPPRLEAIESIELTKKAGIKTVMITGDHKNTAFAIAQKLNIATSIDEVITGKELDELSDRQLDNSVHKYKVFARVAPSHKLRIVEALKKKGEVVAMTGDGINDAPAIKRADIGIAMGSGTDVTKSSSDMIITDDNFATIVVAVKEGRRIYENIKKTIRFFLSTNLAEVISIFLVSIFFRSINFLSSSQLLWINLITDSFPVVAMGVEKAEKNIMQKPPRKPNKGMFDKSTFVSIIYYGVVQTAITLGCFFVSLRIFDNITASTMAFFTLSFIELIHAYNVRSQQSVFSKDFLSNKVLLITVIGAITLNVSMCYVPIVAKAFNIIPLSISQWAVVFGLSFAIIPFGEVYKYFVNKVRKKLSIKMVSKVALIDN